MSVYFANFLWGSNAYSFCEAGLAPQCSTIQTVADLERILTGVSCLRAKYVEERVVSNLSKPLQLTGTILVVRGVGVVLKQEQPKLVTAIGRSGLFEEKKQFKSFPTTMQNTLVSLFTLQLNALLEEFSASVRQEKDGYILTLLPVSKTLRSAVTELNLAGVCYPEDMRITQANGESRKFRFTNISWGPFELSPAEIEALRLASAG